MIMPLELGIGLRYLRDRRRTRFASFITYASMLGIAIGVTALIVILSVMNGFENELRERLLGMSAHATLTATDNQEGVGEVGTAVSKALQVPGVAGAAPLTALEGMIRYDNALYPVLIEGIDPELEASVSALADNLIVGELTDLAPGSNRILLGRVLQLKLGVAPGDSVVVLLPDTRADTVTPVLRRFEFAGMFEAGVQDHDSGLALVHIADANQTLGRSSAASVRLKVDDLFAAPAIAARVAEAVGGQFRVRDWTEENASFFGAVMLEKLMMTLILSLIIAVAAFNIIASLVMVVTDKRTDIAILRTLGLSSRSVVRVFFTQGLVIGWFGVLAGIALGVLLALNVPTIVPALEQFFGFQIMPGDVYVVSDIPSDLRWLDVARIAFVALTLTALATLYPARQAARIAPAVALRYE